MNENRNEIYKNTMRQMMHVSLLHRKSFEREISSMGIHHSQHHLLMFLSKEGEITSQKMIAEKFGITPAAIARTLKELEAEGFIERSSIEEDSRFNKINITDKGKEIVEKTQQMFMKTDESIFLDFSDSDLEQLNEYLNKLKSRLLEITDDICCVRKKHEEE